MNTTSLKKIAGGLQTRSQRWPRETLLVLYILCCALGALACGYVLYAGIDRHEAVFQLTPTMPPVILYDLLPDTLHHKK